MAQRPITLQINKARKRGWCEGREAGRKAALVLDAGFDPEVVAEVCGCSLASVLRAVARVEDEQQRGDAEAKAWIELRANGLGSLPAVEARVRAVIAGEVPSKDPENLRRLAEAVGVDAGVAEPLSFLARRGE